MSETYQFGLPLVQPSQAQKHITVNESLARLDAVAQMRIVEAGLIAPPATPLDGEAYVVGASAIGEWAGHDTSLAVFSNGGWVYLTPKTGWKARNEALAADMIFDGVDWQVNAVAVSTGGAASLQHVIELDHIVSAGVNSITTDLIPSHAQVIGVTARVISEITGSGVASWSLGVAGDEARYASGLGLLSNSYAIGISGAPQTYYADTPLQITADAGTFIGGELRLAVHVVELIVPRAI